MGEGDEGHEEWKDIVVQGYNYKNTNGCHAIQVVKRLVVSMVNDAAELPAFKTCC